MFELGLVSISFREKSAEEILQASMGAGLSFVEWGSDVHAPCTHTDKLCEIARLQEKYGISCSSYGSYFQVAKNQPEEIFEYIKAAKILGTSVIRIWCGLVGFHEETNKEELYQRARELEKIAAKEGVCLCLECHPGTMTDCKEGALAMMQAAGSEHFRLYWQPNQYRTIDENCQYIRELKPWLEHVHVFQWKGAEKYSMAEGREEWAKYLNLLGAPRKLLFEFMPDGKIESLAKEAVVLREIIENL